MKNQIAIIALTVAATYSSFGQGEVVFQNGNTTKISVNSAVGGAATGVAPASTFYYALFSSVAATTVAGSGSSAVIQTSPNSAPSYVFSDANWTFDNAYAVSGTTAGKFAQTPATYDANGAFAQVPGQPGTAQFVVLGWSGNIGTTLASLEAFLSGNENVTGTAYVGESAVSGAFTTGNGTPSAPNQPSNVFSSTAPALQGFTLGVATPAPEPASIALAALGGLSLLGLRRKKA